MQKVQNFQYMAVKRLFALALLLMVSTLTFAQTKVTGTVVDEQGEPLLGVSVLEVGTGNGTSTNMDGVFSLTVGTKAQL